MSTMNLLEVAFIRNDKKTFEALLSHQNTDFTLKNESGLTIIHQAIRHTFEHPKDTSKFTGKLQNYFVDSILRAHVRFSNFDNPCDSNGISHFHAACMSNNAEAVALFIENKVSVNQSVKEDSVILPGYSPLHLAVKYCSLDVAEILLEHEVNMYAKNIEGITPLQMLIKQKMENVINHINETENACNNVSYLWEYVEQEYLHDELTDLLLRKSKTMSESKLAIDYNTGLSSLHIACTISPSTNKMHPMVQRLYDSTILHGIDINHSVKINSPVCPGFTAIQFAAHCNIEAFKLLLTSENINKESLYFNGVSCFDMNIGKNYEDMFDI